MYRDNILIFTANLKQNLEKNTPISGKGISDLEVLLGVHIWVSNRMLNLVYMQMLIKNISKTVHSFLYSENHFKNLDKTVEF